MDAREKRAGAGATRDGSLSLKDVGGFPQGNISRQRGIPQGGRRPLWRLVHRRLSEP
ncbi:hypothetical protein AB9H26_13045 [Yersinia enterocolitica]|uniref:hypothetical protein n=1 Tax=Yersinia enterocolitica TaxID=630 RepID=UPI0021FFA7CB|nr:hypothetical protein FORC065_1478 [Yersinia enterocolitica]HDL7911963.1 hypothetical protein [Yersinia enterocolitica]